MLSGSSCWRHVALGIEMPIPVPIATLAVRLVALGAHPGWFQLVGNHGLPCACAFHTPRPAALLPTLNPPARFGYDRGSGLPCACEFYTHPGICPCTLTTITTAPSAVPTPACRRRRGPS